ncbi:MAG: sensor histidine kinase [Candidatus Rokuibacteriota bacterium]
MFGAGAGLALVLVGLAALMPLLDPAPASPLRYIYVLPVLAAALRSGLLGGTVAAGVAVMAQAPRLFAHLEEDGMTAAAVEELIGYVTLLGVAPLVGALAGAARRQRARYETLLAVQGVVAEERPLPETLHRLRELLAGRCGAAALVLAVRDGDRLALAGGDRLLPGSVLARALDSGEPAFVSDTGTEPRPRRVLAVPLLARGQVIGILGLERVGELGVSERASLIDLGAYLGLALENARLAAVHRRFNAELAEKVATATRRLEALDRAKSTFVATASHELRTPLTALLGFSELLATRRVAAEEVARLAAIVQSETERLARIVDDLLDLSRIEQGTALRVRPVPVVLGPALAAAVEVFRRGVHRIVLACGEGLLVRADPDALDRIVKNLTSNAIKYSPPGSQVTLSAHRHGAGVEVTIADEGPGIAPDALGLIFEPYYRAADATRTAPGIGLGLAVVKALVEAQGGAIAVASAPGHGTRVTFSLPPSLGDAPALVPMVS